MSHFTVMVIGDDHDKLLAPFHEFECTGRDDEYIQDIDETAELFRQYQTHKTTMIRLADGTYRETYDDEFWPLALPNEHDQTFAEYVAEWTGRNVITLEEFEGADSSNLKDEYKYGFTVVNAEGEVVKTIKRTNPNAKWDWYSVGGRWRGFLMLNGEYREAISRYEALAKRGEPIPESLLTKVSRVVVGEKSWTNEDEEIPKYMVDSAPFEAIDWEGMMNEAGVEAGKRWDEAYEIHQGNLWVSWESMFDANENVVDGETLPKLTNSDLRDKYWGQENLKAFVSALREKKGNISPFFNMDEFLKSREEYVIQARDSAISTFAVIKDGQWIERGQMGWFGLASNEKDQKKWSDEFKGLLEGVDPTTQITIVDCHI